MIRSALGTVSAVAIVLVLGMRPAAQPQAFDVIVRGGTVYDGSGNPGRRADVGIRGDRIAAVGDLAAARAATSIDATNMAVAPGFINMLSWSTESLLVDGRSQGEIRQGVTTQIFGEGSSMGPLNDAMKRRMTEQMGDLKFEITWTTLAEYLAELERRGVSQNVASFLGATTVREHVIGLADRKPTAAELDEMRAIVRREMEAGALGIGSSLIYAPAFYATHRGADRALQGGGAVPRQVHLAHPQRGQPADRVGRGADSHRARGRDSGGDLSPQGRRRSQLGEDAAGDRARRGGAAQRAAHHRRHVRLHGGRDGPRRVDAAVGPRRRLRRGLQAPARSGDAPEDRRGHPNAVAGLGEPLPGGWFPRPRAAGRVQVGRAEAAHRQDPRRGGQVARRGSGRHDHEPGARGSLAGSEPSTS